MAGAVPRAAMFFLLLAGCVPRVECQEPAAPPHSGGQFSTSVELVPLSVTVTDGRQQLVRGLTREDFRVLEDGVAQDIVVFGSESVPVDIVLMIDVSASVGERIAIVQEAAIRFVRSLRSDDRVSLLAFNERPRILESWTNDRARVEQAIRATRPSGGTSLFTALYVAVRGLEDLRKQEHLSRRQAIVLLSDGEDTSSLLSFDDVLESCQRAGMSVYTILLEQPKEARGASPRTRAQDEAVFALRQLARETGARAFQLEQVRDLDGAYGGIADELASQYLIAYAPRPTTNVQPFRRLAVQVPTRSGLMLRTRAGYFAIESARYSRDRGQ